jgi:hypothetical protein
MCLGRMSDKVGHPPRPYVTASRVPCIKMVIGSCEQIILSYSVSRKNTFKEAVGPADALDAAFS